MKYFENHCRTWRRQNDLRIFRHPAHNHSQPTQSPFLLICLSDAVNQSAAERHRKSAVVASDLWAPQPTLSIKMARASKIDGTATPRHDSTLINQLYQCILLLRWISLTERADHGKYAPLKTDPPRRGGRVVRKLPKGALKVVLTLF